MTITAEADAAIKATPPPGAPPLMTEFRQGVILRRPLITRWAHFVLPPPSDNVIELRRDEE